MDWPSDPHPAASSYNKRNSSFNLSSYCDTTPPSESRVRGLNSYIGELPIFSLILTLK